MTEQYSGYDLIGDVHGCSTALCELLDLLGYVRRGGVWQYRDQRRPRQALFLGDLIDRGPHIRDTVLLVQAMVEQGHARAIMGNHEYHAVAYHTPARPGSGRGYLREHTERQTASLELTLEQFASYRHDWSDSLRWFRELPLWLDFGHFRMIHACWDQALIEECEQRLPGHCLDEDFLHESAQPGSFAEHFIRRATRGLDLRLPEERVMVGSDGLPRRSFRCKFWVRDPKTYGDLEFQPDRLPPELASLPLREEDRARLVYYDERLPPLFVGHYWLQGEPRPLRANIACLDYSAVKGGRLMAYRMDTEQQGRELDARRFVWVENTSVISSLPC